MILNNFTSALITPVILVFASAGLMLAQQASSTVSNGAGSHQPGRVSIAQWIAQMESAQMESKNSAQPAGGKISFSQLAQHYTGSGQPSVRPCNGAGNGSSIINCGQNLSAEGKTSSPKAIPPKVSFK